MSETSHNDRIAEPVAISRRRKVVFLSFIVLALLSIGEVGSRIFWAMRGVPVWTAQRMIHRSFYPELIPVENATPSRTDDVLDILLLGGSVPNNNYGNIEHLLREKLFLSGHPARVYNVAMPGQTSLDSYYKYRHLQHKQFDVVLVYHGINEVRANNCPPDVFKADYSHYSWYSLINAWERASDSRWFVEPYTFKFLGSKVLERLGVARYVPTHQPRPEDMEWGKDVKTAASLRKNIEGIIRIAAAKNERLILMSFAYYVPQGYSKEKFDKRELDYCSHALPIELWGKPEYVSAAIETHNAIIQTLVTIHQLKSVDQNAEMAKNKNFFNDICHLTHQGCAKFVDNLLPVIVGGTRIDDYFGD